MDFIKKHKKRLLAAAVTGIITATALEHWKYNRTGNLLASASAAWLVFDNLKRKKGVNKTERERHEVPGCEYLNVNIDARNEEDGIIQYTERINNNQADIESILIRGVCYSNLNRHEEAIKDFDAALKLDPSNKTAISYRAASVGSTGDLEGSIEGFKRLLELNPEDYNALASIGTLLPSLGRFGEALPYLNRAIEIDSAEAGLFTARGICEYHTDESRKAIDDLKEALGRGFENVLATYYLALAQECAGERTEALETLSKEITQRGDTGSDFLYIARAKIHLTAGDYEKSVKDASEALRQLPDDDDVLVIRGTAFRMQKYYEEAIRDFSRVIKQSPKNTDALIKRGECFEQLEQAEAALADYSEYIEKEPKEITGYHFRSNILCALGRHQEAIDDLSELLRINPESHDAYLRRGEEWLSLGESKKAQVDKGIGRLKRGIAHKNSGNISAAAKDIEAAYRLGEASAAAYVKELLQQPLIYENIYVKIHFAASENDEPVEELINRIKSMTAEEMLIDADINAEENPGEDSPYRDLSNFIESFGLTGEWWRSPLGLDVYLRVKASQWSMAAEKINPELCTPQSWAARAFQTLDDFFFRCGGRENMYKVMGTAVTEDKEGLLNFLKVVNGEGLSFNEWQLNAPYAYRDLKRSVLQKLEKRVPTKKDTFDGVFAQENQDADYFVNIMNNRVLSLWAHTEWGKKGMNVPYALKSGGDVKNISWYHPEGTFDDRKTESCLYYVYPDGIAVVREHNEYLDLKDDAQVQSGALTVIHDLMGDYDIDQVSDSFYQAVINAKK